MTATLLGLVDRAEHDEAKREAHRAIGRYVVAFSEMVAELRELIAKRIGRDEWPLANIALGYSAAGDVSKLFFWLCRHVGELTEDEPDIANALSRKLDEVIRTRNSMAHGDWLVGYVSVKPVGTIPPRLIHIIPHQKTTPYKVQDLTPADIDRLTDRLLALVTDVVEFGKLALALPVTEVVEGEGLRVSVGELRVSDVYTLQRTGKTDPVRVVRDGPRASDIERIPFV